MSELDRDLDLLEADYLDDLGRTNEAVAVRHGLPPDSLRDIATEGAVVVAEYLSDERAGLREKYSRDDLLEERSNAAAMMALHQAAQSASMTELDQDQDSLRRYATARLLAERFDLAPDAVAELAALLRSFSY